VLRAIDLGGYNALVEEKEPKREFVPIDMEARIPKTAIGMPQDLACASAYVFTWLSGFFWLLVEKRDVLVRTHAATSILVFVPLKIALLLLYGIIAYLVPAIAWVRFVAWSLYGVVALGVVAFWGWLILQGYRCLTPKLPVVSRLAEKIVAASTLEEEIK